MPNVQNITLVPSFIEFGYCTRVSEKTSFQCRYCKAHTTLAFDRKATSDDFKFTAGVDIHGRVHIAAFPG